MPTAQTHVSSSQEGGELGVKLAHFPRALCDLSEHSVDPVPPRPHSPPHPCASEQSPLQAAAPRQDLTVVPAGAMQRGLYFLGGAREGPLRGCGDAGLSLESPPHHWP